jgi:tRNA threonylcarbamoyladenosine biosynthesis protein TsaE
MFTFTSNSESDTERLGRVLAEALAPGTVIALIGPLGAGKTRLVQAVAAAVGEPRENVTSPTFVLVNEYKSGRLPIYHFDTYRLKDDDEFLNLGPEEYFDSSGLTFVEWADRVADLLPAERLVIQIDVRSERERAINLSGTSGTMEDVVTRIQQRIAGK